MCVCLSHARQILFKKLSGHTAGCRAGLQEKQGTTLHYVFLATGLDDVYISLGEEVDALAGEGGLACMGQVRVG